MKNGFPVFSTLIEANYILNLDDANAQLNITEEERQIFTELSVHPNIFPRLVSSIAPSIHGHDDIKTALLLSMLGGVAKDVKGKHRIRGDINLLLLGDPGACRCSCRIETDFLL